MTGHVVPWCVGCGLPEHEWPHPRGAADGFWDIVFGCLRWVEYLDDDAMDADVHAWRGRLPSEGLELDGFAEAVGLAPKSVWSLVGRGLLPAPARRELRPTRGGFQKVGIWTTDQVAEALQRRRVKASA